MSIRRFAIKVNGESQLLLSNNQCSDPLSEASKTKKHFTGKRVKADKDHQNLRVIDWVYSGYWGVDGKVIIDDTENSVSFRGFESLYMPAQNFQRCLRNGATAFKLGKEVERALIVENNPEIEFDGPSTAQEMLDHNKFVNTSPVVRQKVTNWCTRIVIPEWSCTFNVTIDDDRISIDSLERIANAAGRFEGLGTWRPRYGRFSSVLEELEV